MIVGIELLAILVAVNGAPILAARLLGRRWDAPVDGGRRWPDGRPVFGVAKTWRGLLAGLLAGALVAAMTGYGPGTGLALGILSLVGDLLSSFAKRRMGLEPSDRCPGLDQLPESLLPTAYAVYALDLPWWWLLLLPALFTLVDRGLSGPLYRLQIRKRPY